ncbi:MAG TPA: hypothetical protein PL137_22350, partial [Nocardioides sp.]|nr:hypothetical protein [Nocardioides sp.]
MTRKTPQLSRRGLLAAAAVGTLSACSGDDSGTSSGPSSGPPTGSASTGSGATSSAAPSGSPTNADWAQLGRSVEGSLVLPSDPTYNQVRLLENPRYDDERPLAVLQVSSAQDLIAAQRCFLKVQRLG